MEAYVIKNDFLYDILFRLDAIQQFHLFQDDESHIFQKVQSGDLEKISQEENRDVICLNYNEEMPGIDDKLCHLGVEHKMKLCNTIK